MSNHTLYAKHFYRCRWEQYRVRIHALWYPLPSLPHKTSKSSTPYKRTKPSTLQRMREVRKEHKPKDIVEIIDNEVGGIEGADSLSALTRDNQQVRNARRNLFTDKRDEFAAILERCKLNYDEGFIRSIQAAPEPACVLTTDTQLDQLQINCTSDSFSVMTVVQLGRFFLSLPWFLRRTSS